MHVITRSNQLLLAVESPFISLSLSFALSHVHFMHEKLTRVFSAATTAAAATAAAGAAAGARTLNTEASTFRKLGFSFARGFTGLIRFRH